MDTYSHGPRESQNKASVAARCALMVAMAVYPVVDPGVPGGPGPPAPVKTCQKKDGHCAMPQVEQVIGPPPPDKFLDPLI